MHDYEPNASSYVGQKSTHNYKQRSVNVLVYANVSLINLIKSNNPHGNHTQL